MFSLYLNLEPCKWMLGNIQLQTSYKNGWKCEEKSSLPCLIWAKWDKTEAISHRVLMTNLWQNFVQRIASQGRKLNFFVPSVGLKRAYFRTLSCLWIFLLLMDNKMTRTNTNSSSNKANFHQGQTFFQNWFLPSCFFHAFLILGMEVERSRYMREHGVLVTGW